jgi:hypothetical protein
MFVLLTRLAFGITDISPATVGATATNPDKVIVCCDPDPLGLKAIAKPP